MTTDAAKLIGTWKAVSFAGVDEATGKETRTFGEHPKGYLIFLPSRMFAFISFENRNPPQQAGEGAPRLPSMMAYSGPYEVSADSFTTMVDMSAFEGWVGTKQKRFFKIEGDTLEITTPTITGRDGALVHSRLIWQRET